jgi:hypothetical protein
MEGVWSPGSSCGNARPFDPRELRSCYAGAGFMGPRIGVTSWSLTASARRGWLWPPPQRVMKRPRAVVSSSSSSSGCSQERQPQRLKQPIFDPRHSFYVLSGRYLSSCVNEA